jgi:hypothetical protein
VFVAGISAATASAEDGVVLERAGWWLQPRPQDPLPLAPSDTTSPRSGLVVSFVADAGAPPVPGVNQPVGGTVAYSAVRFKVPDGWVGSLTLTSAAGPVAAAVQACGTTGSWQAAEAGAWAMRPGVDLSQCSVGEAAADGLSVKFSIGTDVTRHGVLDVAIVPAPKAAAFSVRFDVPTAGSLTGRSGSNVADGWSAAPGPALPSSASAPETRSPGASPPVVSRSGAASTQPRTTPGEAPRAAGSTALPSASPGSGEQRLARGGVAALALLCLLGTGSVLLYLRGRAAPTDERGVGRFTAVRSTAPSAL